MNTKTSTIISVAVIAAIIGFAVYMNFYLKPATSKMTVQSMKDGRGISIGEMRPQYKQSDPSKWSPETRKRVEEYERDVKAIDEGWHYIGRGNNYVKLGQYETAVEAYKRAYEIDRGDRLFSGHKLIEAYEKLGRYDEALALLDEMEKEFELSEKGKQDFAATRTRLLAAKEKSFAANQQS